MQTQGWRYAPTKRAALIWPTWLGGMLMLAGAYAPQIVFAKQLEWTFGQAVIYGGVILGTLPVMGFMAMTAPLIGQRRRRALWCVLPLFNFGVLWKFGELLVECSNETAAD